jgi:hypothetical protein
MPNRDRQSRIAVTEMSWRTPSNVYDWRRISLRAALHLGLNRLLQASFFGLAVQYYTAHVK